MLKDEAAFFEMEKFLRENGAIEKYEKENGEIKGHMMIDLCEIPEGLGIEVNDSKAYAFEASFDFYDSTVGTVLNPITKEARSGIWVTPQVDDAEPPTQEWIEFFIKVLLDSISEDGSFGHPIYVFMGDVGHLAVVPGKPDR